MAHTTPISQYKQSPPNRGYKTWKCACGEIAPRRSVFRPRGGCQACGKKDWMLLDGSERVNEHIGPVDTDQSFLDAPVGWVLDFDQGGKRLSSEPVP